ncbi:MAG: hypothetical protein QOG43_380 [Actinomycetota bacterium]|nr:hypothetical protein [Actinomycetota bacterium]
MSLALDGGEAHEPADALWLQAPLHFADLRTDLTTGAVHSCFAGTTAWFAPVLRWTHEIDLDPRPRGVADDVGQVSWDGDDLLERGVFAFPGTDGPVPYVERWRRLAGDRPVVATVGAGRIRVVAGAHALEVARTATGVAATSSRLTPAGWQAVRTVAAAVRNR